MRSKSSTLNLIFSILFLIGLPVFGSTYAFAEQLCQAYGTGKIKKYKLEEGKTLPFAINKRLVKVKPSPKRGKKVFLDHEGGNCLACHQISLPKKKNKSKNNNSMELYRLQGSVAGSLDGVAKRYTPGELRMIIVDPRAAFPGKTIIMPAYYVLDGLNDVVAPCEGKTMLSERQIEDLISFLNTLK